MAMNVAQKLIRDHLVEGEMEPGSEIGLRIDQTLTQDATGTLVVLELEAMELDRTRAEVSVQYIDHNLIQTDFRNQDDHLFLESACRRFGLWFSRPGNGVSHPVHQERFGIPGKTLLGSDSHTPACGAIGMLAIGAGGLEVALTMAGEPFYFNMPKVLGVKLTGALPDWVSAKDVILEMLRRHGVKGGLGMIVEYYGPGLETLSAMDRHVIANMGTELGATTSVFPSDEETRRFLESQGRGEDWEPLVADDGATYDAHDHIDLTRLEPLIALPSSPGNVVPVREVAGQEIFQAYIGSSANPGLRDFAVPALMVEDRQIPARVSFDVNPSSRQILENMILEGHLSRLVRAGARIHQAGCNGCIGMGQAPATGRRSLRTVPRNFPGRSGTKEDAVYLCSPETATASALAGRITDPRDMDTEMEYPRYREPAVVAVNVEMLQPPPDAFPGGGDRENGRAELIKGPNIESIPELDPLRSRLSGPVLIKVGDDISTDEILPAGARVLPFRSNIPEISRFTFYQVDDGYSTRVMDHQMTGHFVVGGENYGQGSSREHAALAPRFLGVKSVLAKSFARIHAQNLVNFGVLPLTFRDPDDYDRIDFEDQLELSDVRGEIQRGTRVTVRNCSKGDEIYKMEHSMSHRQVQMVLSGSILSMYRESRRAGTPS